MGLCLAQAAMQKETFLERLGVQGTWPIFGKPENIYVDNGAEFYSEAFVRGCEQHGIKIHRRKKGFPNHSGIVERIIGTLMAEIHALPGTTFSNIQMRGNYDSEGKAILTLTELERWLTLVIVGKYHLDVHATLMEPPLVRFRKGLNDWQPQSIRVENHRSFFLDFLPLTRRSLQRHGFVVNHIFYFSNALSPWIASGKVNQNFTLRIDPRDLSRIFVLHPKETEYLEVPYRSLHRPTITAWEHRESIRKLKAKGASTVDEASIFRAISEMRALEENSESATKSARKRKESRSRIGNIAPTLQVTSEEPQSKKKSGPELPFEVIEEW